MASVAGNPSGPITDCMSNSFSVICPLVLNRLVPCSAVTAGSMAKAITDFDRLVTLNPRSDPFLWQRGIAYYYAGRYQDGVAQFERHQRVNPNDVENAAWHFICTARATNVTTARRTLIPIRGDTRIPMNAVHALFANQITPDDVISAAEAAPPAERLQARCYGHQYVGMYYEAMGRPDLAQQHMKLAAETHNAPNYMGKIAKLHYRLMQAERAAPSLPHGHSYSRLREGLPHAQTVFEKTKRGRVAFIGGSITQSDGWRKMIYALLAKRFPHTQFDYVTAGLSSTGSTTGAFRLQTDVLSQGKTDLFFIEFAVNDNQDSHRSTTAAIRGMEGLVRHARAHNPNMDILFTYFVNDSHLRDYQAGIIPDEIMSHERVAEFYSLPSINLAHEVADAITGKNYTWQDYGGTHPQAFGQKVYAARVNALFAAAWDRPRTNDVHPVVMPSDWIDTHSYARGRYLPAAAIALGDWHRNIPDLSAVPGTLRPTHQGMELIHCESPGVPLTATFSGTAIGAYLLAGPDAGQLEYRIDHAEWKRVDLYHRFSRSLHYPRTIIFDDELVPGNHTIVIRLSRGHHAKSSGTAARLLALVVN
jgi:lysophospholipase L1-like esterase